MNAFFAQISETLAGVTPMVQMGFGGALLVVVVRWLSRVEAGLQNVEHAMRSLSKAIWMDLSERAAPGSFVREEAKRTLKRMEDSDRADDEAYRKKRGTTT